MDILKKSFKVKTIIAYLLGGFCSFYIIYFLGGIAYLAPYTDGNLTPVFILCLFLYYVCGFLAGVVITDSARRAFRIIHTTLLMGIVLFFIYLIPFKADFTNDIANGAYHGILKDMGLSKDKSETVHTNKDIDDIYEAYKNKDISKLAYFDSKIDDVKTIKDETFAQLIVNVRVLNKKVITDFYNKILEDKRISINEYNEMIKLIVSEELK